MVGNSKKMELDAGYFFINDDNLSKIENKKGIRLLYQQNKSEKSFTAKITSFFFTKLLPHYMSFYSTSSKKFYNTSKLDIDSLEILTKEYIIF